MSALNCQRFWFGNATRRYLVEGCGEAIGHFEQFEAQVIVQPFRGTPGDALDLLGRQLTAGRTRDPADQFVRLVDDHRAVFGQRGSTMHRVDGQERVVGDDQIGLSCPRPGGLHEAFRPVRAFGGAQALPDGYRNLGPCARRVARRVIAVGQAMILGLGLGPLAQPQHFDPEGGRGVRSRASHRLADL